MRSTLLLLLLLLLSLVVSEVYGYSRIPHPRSRLTNNKITNNNNNKNNNNNNKRNEDEAACIPQGPCVRENEPCGVVKKGEGQVFVGCYSGLYCGSDRACHKLVANGGNCTSDEECIDILDVSSPIRFCMDGSCQALKYTRTKGQSCDDEYNNCISNLYCENNTCVEYSKLGESCLEAECNPNTAVCSNDICVEFFSVPEGGECWDSYFEDEPSFTCAPGLYCNMETTTCTRGFQSSNTPCTSENDCKENESCSCNKDYTKTICVAPTVLTEAKAKSYKDYLSCINSANCENGCCEKETCSVIDRDAYKCSDSCSNKLSRGAIVGIAVGGAAFIAIVTSVTVYLHRKGQPGYGRPGSGNSVTK